MIGKRVSIWGAALFVSAALFADQSTPEKTVMEYHAKEIPKLSRPITISPLDVFLSSRAIEARHNRLVKLREKAAKSEFKIRSVAYPTKTTAVVVTNENNYGHIQSRKYDLVSEGGRWKIDDIYYGCLMCGGTGERENTAASQEAMKVGRGPIMEKCMFCDGQPWQSEIYPDPRRESRSYQ